MSAVTGPISTMPGSSHNLPDGSMCDFHPDRPAVARIQGETDSMGSEMNDMCQACLDQHRTAMKEWRNRTGRCDWCKCEVDNLANMRDFEEGSCGPIYQVCQPCRAEYHKKIEEELAESAAEFDFGDDYDDDDYGVIDDDYPDEEEN